MSYLKRKYEKKLIIPAQRKSTANFIIWNKFPSELFRMHAENELLQNLVINLYQTEISPYFLLHYKAAPLSVLQTSHTVNNFFFVFNGAFIVICWEFAHKS